jgi:hypothetical protein
LIAGGLWVSINKFMTELYKKIHQSVTNNFSCIGTFFNIEKRMEIQFEETRKTSGTTQIGQKKKIKNTKSGRKTLTLVQKYSTSPKSMKSANNFNISFNQNSAFNDTLETFTAFV